MAMAFFRMSRSIFNRSFSLLSWRSSSASETICPLPGNASSGFAESVHPLVEGVLVNAHIEGNLAHTLTALGDELYRFNLEFSGVRLPLLCHDSPSVLLVLAAFRTVHKTGEDSVSEETMMKLSTLHMQKG